MNNAFKPLGLAAAVAAASTGVANAQTYGVNDIGDLALVPYYTVAGEWVTGIHIVNTSDTTQVVKFRFRRASDSLDALDFNIVMSPKDVYAGFLSDPEGVVTWASDDTTCTVPFDPANPGSLEMPKIYNPDGTTLGQTGYVEVIAMGAPTSETQPIAVGAKHVEGTPANCAAVRSNFFANGDPSDTDLTIARGVIDSETTYQVDPAGAAAFTGMNTFEDSGNVLKVSYFIRDNASGVEFGDNAVHIADFITEASITNQEYGWLSGDLDGFDFPNLDGTSPGAVNAQRDRFDMLRGILGNTILVNEWSVNPDNGVQLDWVVTMPGQYTMFDTPQYVISKIANNATDLQIGPPLDSIPVTAGSTCPRGTCDFRDLPVTVAIRNYDREERFPTPEGPEPGDLVVSPNVPDPTAPVPVTRLTQEVNVITFGEEGGVLGQSDVRIGDPGVPQPFGWLNLSVSSADSDLRVCNWNAAEDLDEVGGEGLPLATEAKLLDLNDGCDPVVNTGVPMIGFAAWQRSVAANPDASYGRIVEHSYASSL